MPAGKMPLARWYSASERGNRWAKASASPSAGWLLIAMRILPDGALWRVPFHALIDRSGKHLIERAAIAYSPSLALTKRCDSIRPAQKTLLVFGDPFRDVNLDPLPEAETEARTIAKLYDEAQVRVGNEARESVFKDEASSYRVLHLAAHSILDDAAPMFSSIVLAASDANPLEDGLLEAREVADLRLGAELVVLSACETARGAVAPGEGILGLSWAFLAAGVPATVVSQWKVGSASTSGLMIDFHRELRDGAAPAEALRAAMLALRRDPRWQHPFYWAPFVVIENSNGSPKRQ
jgi:CHAT domain-containing protein